MPPRARRKAAALAKYGGDAKLLAIDGLEQHGGDVRVGEDHLDGLRDRLGLRAAAGVEEVGRRAAVAARDCVVSLDVELAAAFGQENLGEFLDAPAGWMVGVV